MYPRENLLVACCIQLRADFLADDCIFTAQSKLLQYFAQGLMAAEHRPQHCQLQCPHSAHWPAHKHAIETSGTTALMLKWPHRCYIYDL